MSLNLQESPKDGELISRMRQLRPRGVQGLSQGHTAASGKARVGTQDFCFLVPFPSYSVCPFSDEAVEVCAEGKNWMRDTKPEMSEWQVIPQWGSLWKQEAETDGRPRNQGSGFF